MRTYIKELKFDEPTTIKGYVDTVRDLKHLKFVVVRDSSAAIQVCVVKDEMPELAKIVETLTVNSFVSIEGKCIEQKSVKFGGREFVPTNIIVESIADVLPIDEKSGLDQRLNYRWIDLRDEKKLLIFKIQTAFEHYARCWFVEHGFIEIHSPKLTGLSSEGGSEVFEVANYFGQKAYLTQSPQLYKQMAMCAGFDKVFEVGPYFRANPSFTSRHDTEFTGMDLEVSHIESHHDIMDIEEELLKYTLKRVKEQYGDEFKALFEKEMIAPEIKFPRIPLLEAYKLIEEEKGYKVPKYLKGDLDPEGERLISEIAKEKFGSEFVFITDFPTKARAFYTMKHEEDPNISKSFDLLFRGQEITSGAQREHRVEVLRERIRENGINPDNMAQYLEFFTYGAPTHGGFGFGLTRLLSKLFDLPSVKDVTFLFRGPSRLFP